MVDARAGGHRITEHPLLGSHAIREVVPFTFDGRGLYGVAGEPIAAALLAHGIQAFRSMPDTGEPRGLFSGVGRSLDGLMMVDGIPNVSVSVTPLRAFSRVRTQHGLGSWEES